MSYRSVISSTTPLAVNQMDHKHADEQYWEHYLYRISGRADLVQWLDMLAESFWKAIFLILISIECTINSLQRTLTIQCDKSLHTMTLFATLPHIELNWRKAFWRQGISQSSNTLNFRTTRDHPCPRCIPAGACLSSPLIWQKDPSQALFLGLIVCDIHNTALVNGYLRLGGEQGVSLLSVIILECFAFFA